MSNTPQKICGVFAYMPAAVFPQKVNARRSLAPRFLALFENYPPFTHFPFAGWAAYAAFFSQGIISNTPQKFAGCPRFYPTENSFGGDPEIYPTRKIKDFSRGDPVCACGCVSAKGKCKTFTCSAFPHSARKLSTVHSFPSCGMVRPATDAGQRMRSLR